MKKNLKELFNLKDKIIVLTGARGLLGIQYQDILIEAGAIVLPIDLKSDSKYKVDISSEEQVIKMRDDIVKEYGKIDILINNAIHSHHKEEKIAKLNEISVERWKTYIDVNLTGTFICCKIIGEQMEKQGFGNIINISSIYGVVGVDQRIYENMTFNSPISYSATKGAIISMTKWLASYWRGKNIRVNCLSPGGVNSSKTYKLSEKFIENYSYRTILGRMANEYDYRGAMLFLCSDASSYMTGSNLIIDGGWTAC